MYSSIIFFNYMFQLIIIKPNFFWWIHVGFTQVHQASPRAPRPHEADLMIDDSIRFR